MNAMNSDILYYYIIRTYTVGNVKEQNVKCSENVFFFFVPKKYSLQV